jgi:hypothetical protein
MLCGIRQEGIQLKFRGWSINAGTRPWRMSEKQAHPSCLHLMKSTLEPDKDMSRCLN